VQSSASRVVRTLRISWRLESAAAGAADVVGVESCGETTAGGGACVSESAAPARGSGAEPQAARTASANGQGRAGEMGMGGARE
jgi:hypothetical protein